METNEPMLNSDDFQNNVPVTRKEYNELLSKLESLEEEVRRLKKGNNPLLSLGDNLKRISDFEKKFN